MMGRGGGRSLVLLCSFATLLLISSSAVSGVLDENVREFGRFAGRFRREHLEEGGAFASDTVVDEKKPAEGILEKARSFLSGFSTFVGNGIPNPAASLFEKPKLAWHEKEEKSFGRRWRMFGRHHGFGRSRWAGIRDLIRNHPERLAAAAAAAADISATEPLVLEEDVIPVTPVAALRANIRGIVMTVAEEYNALTVETNLAPTCADALEKQVKLFVRSVKSALRERLCNADVVSMEEQTFCNLFNDHPMMATFQSLWMTGVNPVKVPWHQTSKTAACSSVNPFSDFVDSLKEMEGLAGQFNMLLPEVIDMDDKHMEHGYEHHMFHEHRHEHERHWWQRMVHKMVKPHHFEERHEHGDHVKHWWQRVFGIFHKDKQMRHYGFEHTHENSDRDVCFYKSVKYLTRGIKQHLATTCQSTTSPNVIAACKFAREHHFLVKAWLAVKMPVWIKAAKSCIHNFENRHAPTLGIGHLDIVEHHPVDAEDLASNERQLNTFPPWIARSCGKHRANREFSRALHLRGHVIGISSSNDGENGLGGLVRTRLIVLAGHPIHLHDFHDAFENLHPLDHGSSEEMVTDLQDRLAEFVREADLVTEAVSGEQRAVPDSRTEMMLFKPFHHHAKGPHFRISAMPRVVGESNNEITVIETPEEMIRVGEDAGSDVQLQDKTPKESAENRADM